MRLYSRNGTVSVEHDGKSYAAGSDGGFDFPEDLAQSLHSFHSQKKPLWETDIERQNRLVAEEAARRADPATLLEAVEKIQRLAEGNAPEPAAKAAPAKAAAAK